MSNSTATKPVDTAPPQCFDDDWHHMEETLAMLCLAIAQIETALNDGSVESNQFSESFAGVAQQCDNIAAMASDEETTIDRHHLLAMTSHIKNHIQSAVVAFQFYDRVSQRLDHVAGSLRKLLNVMGDDSVIHNPQSWKDIQDEIKSTYTMDSERVMFEQIMRGVDIDDALQTYRHNFINSMNSDSDNTDDEIELF